ncbi:MAG: CPBP family intramembrane metalloprotease [Altererythrobacter sp.]|nr:CPBP family intramembrane metalloprotease [Altererythrobacter sp.]MBK62655.1 CPBP family intramembrane metalloprotease [Altererythrobacter sp.]|tara:strand:- start:1763 stop:2488 length:726 start_codon:yes stop_codon:yes gene_type:complete
MPPRRLKLQGLFILILLALTAAASLLLMPLEAVLPAGVDLPRAVFIIQPSVLLLVSAVVGWWAAPKVDLKAPILSSLVRQRPWKASLRCAILPSVVVGIAGALVLAAYGAATASFFADAEAALDPPLVTRILYGGIGEEIMLRWGLMSLLALMASKLTTTREAALWSANVLAAVLFGLGHLPTLYAIVAAPPAWIVATVIAGNAVLGVAFGWLYMRRGLEAAMLGHILAHLFAAAGALALA